VGIRGSKDEFATPHNASGVCHAARQNLVHTISLSRTAPQRLISETRSGSSRVEC
jgi:hypothetical protein